MILHDLRCKACGAVEEDVRCSPPSYPECVCGSTDRTWIPRKVTSDIFSTPKFNHATGQWHTSTRDVESTMAKMGYSAAGDKVHGARDETWIKESAFSFSGQGSRRSSAERNLNRRRQTDARARQQAPSPSSHEVGGVQPKRMTETQYRKDRVSKKIEVVQN